MSKYTPQYHTACQIQRKILRKMGLEFQDANHAPKPAKSLDDDLSPKDLALLTSSWNTLEERKRILRMKPKPRDVDVAEKKKAKPSASFSE
jgi:hypothetical protein